MSSCSNEQSKELGCLGHESAVSDNANLTECRESPVGAEEDEDEEEDIDFNPFLKETLSPEASSSLSSEVEVLDANVVDGEENNFESAGIGSSKLAVDAKKFAVGVSENDDEETVMQTTVSSRGQCQKEPQKAQPKRPKKRKVISSSPKEIEVAGEKEIGSSSGTDVNDPTVREVSNATPQKPTIDLDDDDAICKRTRARYSLVSFTLDELETFLQETDDDDDLQNVDDEEEYKKFLAAVLLGGDSDGHPAQENENVDDEDEDNDADFEIELEEALESDPDDSAKNKIQMDEHEGGGRRPETRQNRRQKASSQNRKNLLGQAKRPLRPLLPILPNVSNGPFFTHDGKTLMPEATSSCQSSRAEDSHVNGFSPHQIGQLHCLIHEHMQLLIQVFSLCVLDHSRQHVASQVEGLVLELLHKRDQVLTWRNVPYADFLFHPPYICPSAVDQLPKDCPAQCTVGSSNTFDAQVTCSPSHNQMPDSSSPNLQVGTLQDVERSPWMPRISGPVISILDVAPLKLVGPYIHDIHIAIREYRRRHFESGSDAQSEREPLFPFPNFPSFAEANCDISRAVTPSANLVSPSPSQQQPKKTLAATIVESTMKQSIALVPKEIAKLAQRFFPLFNAALFPHKPPSVAVANRVLFTDSEDELLALGMMEYNTDWKAIQLRFLPCKDKHQIFVRQKNRCSSKAPENPIKAVRRMKTSPLTSEEIERIQEGLKVFKLDWMSVWKFIVPYRDPSLLPRQWRIAIGTQRSYKNDSAKREKRRLYELKRRRSKTADLANWQTESAKEDCPAEYAGGQNSGGDDYPENADEAFVHEAFLADWRPDTYSHISSECPQFNLRENNMSSQEGGHIRERPYGSREDQPQMGNMHEYPSASKGYQHPQMPSLFARDRNCVSNPIEQNHPVSGVSMNTQKSQIFSRPYRVRKANSARLVKLAPDLPPVNLPPSVRVISQSAFQNYQCGISTKASTAGSGAGNVGKQIIIPQLSHVAKLGTTPLVNVKRNKTDLLKDSAKKSCAEDSEVVMDKCVVGERGTDSDLHMHPLLYKTLEDGRLPYFPLNCSSSTSSSFSFFSGNRAQLNLSLFHNSQQANYGVDSFNKSLRSKESTLVSSGIDFHPLLQRNDHVSGELVTGHPPVNLEGNSTILQNRFSAIQTGSPVNNSCPSTNGIVPSSPNERTNELDLEIYLSSTSRKGKATESNDVTARNHGATVGTQNTTPYYQQSENDPALSSTLASGAHSSVGPRVNICRYSMDDIGEQSHPGIVMEQEELSDSDEEIEEHVEFECEEMADSEGEESGSEETAEVQNKEAVTFERENIESDVDSDNQQCDQMTNVHPQENTPPRKDTPSGHEKHVKNRSWLSLDSCAPDASPNEDRTTAEGGAAKSSAISRPNRTCKKAAPSTNIATPKNQATDMAEQLSLCSSLAIQRLKNPRRRVYKTNPGVNKGLPMGRSQSDSTDKVD